MTAPSARKSASSEAAGILEFIEQDAEIWQEVERFAQLPDDAVSQSDIERLYAALTKAEAAWRRQRSLTRFNWTGS